MGGSRILSCSLVAGLSVASMGSSSCDADGSMTSRAREVHVSLVPKGTVTTFLNRLATADGQVVATRGPVAGARQSIALKEEPGVVLHLVEGPLPVAALPRERARLGGTAVIAVPAGHDPHDWLGSHRDHVEPIAVREVAVPGALPRPEAPYRSADPSALDPAPPGVAIDQEFLGARLRELSGAAPTVVGGRSVTLRERGSPEGRALARAWLRERYEGIGFVVREETYRGGLYGDGVNVIAEKAGADPSRVLILSAHYDSVGNAGADDDGSGTVSALAIARALKDADLAIGLRVVAFDQEERGLLGSEAYARALSEAGQLRQVVGVLNLEMTAYDSDDDGHYHVIDCGENTSPELSARVVEAAGSRGDLRLTRVDACTNRSDHASFWRHGAPAVAISEDFFGGDDNPCYHARCDRIDRLNLDYMRRLTQAVGTTVARWITADGGAP
jgi:Peptidase family M28